MRAGWPSEASDFNSPVGRREGRVEASAADGCQISLKARGIETGALQHHADELRASGATVVFVAIDGAPAGLMPWPIRSSPRAEAVARPSKKSLRLVMMTGDTARPRWRRARSASMRWRLTLPQDKAALVELRAEGAWWRRRRRRERCAALWRPMRAWPWRARTWRRKRGRTLLSRPQGLCARVGFAPGDGQHPPEPFFAFAYNSAGSRWRRGCFTVVWLVAVARGAAGDGAVVRQRHRHALRLSCAHLTGRIHDRNLTFAAALAITAPAMRNSTITAPMSRRRPWRIINTKTTTAPIMARTHGARSASPACWALMRWGDARARLAAGRSHGGTARPAIDADGACDANGVYASVVRAAMQRFSPA